MSARRLVLAAVLIAGCGSAPVASSTPNGYVPWLPLPPQHQYVDAPLASPVPPIPVPAGTPVCQASQLEGVNLGMSGATGNVNMPLLFRNRGGSDCYIEGYPDATVLSPTGKVLASGFGTAGRGTFFDDGPVVQVMLRSGTPALPPPGPGYSPPMGDAFMNLSWYDCRPLQANRLALDMPAGGGHLVIPFDMHAYYSAACDASNNAGPSLFRGPLSPTGVQWPPGPDYIRMAVSISAPPSAKRGSSLTYYVTVSNRDTRDYALMPCPDYIEFLMGKKQGGSYQLNCPPAGHVSPGKSVTFQMQLAIGADQESGPSYVNWGLQDGRIDPSTAQAPITIT